LIVFYVFQFLQQKSQDNKEDELDASIENRDLGHIFKMDNSQQKSFGKTTVEGARALLIIKQKEKQHEDEKTIRKKEQLQKNEEYIEIIARINKKMQREEIENKKRIEKSKVLRKNMFEKINEPINLLYGDLNIEFLKAFEQINIYFYQQGIRYNMFIDLTNNIIYFSKERGRGNIPLIEGNPSKEQLKQLKKDRIKVFKTKLQGLNQLENEFHKSLILLLNSLDINNQSTYIDNHIDKVRNITINNAFFIIPLSADESFRGILDNMLNNINEGLSAHLKSKALVDTMFSELEKKKINDDIILSYGDLNILFKKQDNLINIFFIQSSDSMRNMFIDLTNNRIYFSKQKGSLNIPLIKKNEIKDPNGDQLTQLKENTIGVFQTKLQELNQQGNAFYELLRSLLESLDINENSTFMSESTTGIKNAFFNIRLGLDETFRKKLDKVLKNINDGLTNYLNSKGLVDQIFHQLGKNTTMQNGGLNIEFTTKYKKIIVYFKENSGIEYNMFIDVTNNKIYFSKQQDRTAIELIQEGSTTEKLDQSKKDTIGVFQTKLAELNQPENEFYTSLISLLESLDIHNAKLIENNKFWNIRFGLDKTFRAKLDKVLNNINNGLTTYLNSKN